MPVQFSMRTLLVVTAIAAVLTMPTYRYSVDVYKRWTAPEQVTVQLPVLATTTVNTVVSVPDGGTVIFGGISIRRDGSKWVNGKMVSDPRK